MLANILRNVWAYAVIFCGHFPDGAEKFTVLAVEKESKSEWYLRQMLGTANFRAGRVLAFASGHLCYQIEHHLFPDLPSNRYPEIAARVRSLCDKYDLGWYVITKMDPQYQGGIQIDKSYGLTTLRDHHVDIGRPSESGAGQQSDVATVSHACNR